MFTNVTSREMKAMGAIIFLAVFGVLVWASVFGVTDDAIGSMIIAPTFLSIEALGKWLKRQNLSWKQQGGLLVVIAVVGQIMLLVAASFLGGLADDLKGGYPVGWGVFAAKHAWDYFKETLA